MKMTMHIDEAVLAEVMELTGAESKTAAVEMALRDLARRHKQRKLFRTPLWETEEERRIDATPHPSEALDPPDIDEEAVERFFHDLRNRRQSDAARTAPPSAFALNEDSPSPPAPSSPPPSS